MTLKTSFYYYNLVNYGYSYLQYCFYRMGLSESAEKIQNEKVFLFCLNIYIYMSIIYIKHCESERKTVALRICARRCFVSEIFIQLYNSCFVLLSVQFLPEVHLVCYSVDTACYFSGLKASAALMWPLISIYSRDQECVKQYLYSHDIMLN